MALGIAHGSVRVRVVPGEQRPKKIATLMVAAGNEGFDGDLDAFEIVLYHGKTKWPWVRSKQQRSIVLASST